MGEVSQRYGEPITPNEQPGGLQDRLRSGVERVHDKLQRADSKVRSFVSERPLTAVAVALGAGFLIGKLISRRRGGSDD